MTTQTTAGDAAKLAAIRELVNKTWPAEEHARLHPALQPASIRVAFLRILDGPQ